MTIQELIEKSKARAKVHKSFMREAVKEISDRTIICIPDMHLLDKGPGDDFYDAALRNEEEKTSYP